MVNEFQPSSSRIEPSKDSTRKQTDRPRDEDANQSTKVALWIKPETGHKDTGEISDHTPNHSSAKNT